MNAQMRLSSLSQLALALLLITQPACQVFAGSPKKHVDYKGMAMAPVAEISGFNGWSAGVGLGVMTSATSTKFRSVTQADQSPFLSVTDANAFNSYARSMIYKYGAMGNLFAGYGYLNDIYYVGFNAGFNFLGANQLKLNQVTSAHDVVTDIGVISVSTITNTSETYIKYTRGRLEPFLDLKLGGLITPQTLSYGIIGTSYNSLTIKESSNYCSDGIVTPFIGPGGTASTSNNIGYSQTKRFLGLRLGAGMETLLTPNFGVAADYVYSFYPTFKSTTTNRTTTVACDTVGGCTSTAATVVSTLNTSLSDQQIMAKFIYHFG